MIHTTKNGDVLGVGLHTDIDAETYHGIDACSQSALKPLLQGKTLKHVRHAMLAENVPTPAMQLGTALHSYILEHETFGEHIVEGPDCRRRKKKDKETWRLFEEANEGRVILSAQEMQSVRDMGDAVLYHESVRHMFEHPTEIETTCLWREPFVTEYLNCKARIDLFIDELGMVVDLKTTPDASREAFERSIFKFGYHYQAAMYLRALNETGRTAKEFVLIAVEKEAPYCCAVYRLAPEVVALAWEEMQHHMKEMAFAYAVDRWDGYIEYIADISLPRWAMRDTVLHD